MVQISTPPAGSLTRAVHVADRDERDLLYFGGTRRDAVRAQYSAASSAADASQLERSFGTRCEAAVSQDLHQSCRCIRCIREDYQANDVQSLTVRGLYGTVQVRPALVPYSKVAERSAQRAQYTGRIVPSVTCCTSGERGGTRYVLSTVQPLRPLMQASWSGRSVRGAKLRSARIYTSPDGGFDAFARTIKRTMSSHSWYGVQPGTKARVVASSKPRPFRPADRGYFWGSGQIFRHNGLPGCLCYRPSLLSCACPPWPKLQ
jgi:hypothetical protein